MKRSAFLAVWTYTKAGAVITIHDYYGVNGAGAVYAPDDVTASAVLVTFKWTSRLFEDPYQVVHPLNAKGGKVSGHGTASRRGSVVVTANSVVVRAFDSADVAADGKFTVVLS
jgi:hypothetical protein